LPLKTRFPPPGEPLRCGPFSYSLAARIKLYAMVAAMKDDPTKLLPAPESESEEAGE